MNDQIVIKGARVNNLKNVDLTIPKNKLVVFTGVSGSGKSTLAFDTIYAEGQRRYVESLSSYARMFLGTVDKPDVDSIEGLSPAIAIDQKTTSHNPRSTVGTVTEIYDYLRLLYARIGVAYCPTHNLPIKGFSLSQIVAKIKENPKGTDIYILSPLVRNEKGTHNATMEKFINMGFKRMKIDNTPICRYQIPPALEKNKKHSISIVIDHLTLGEDTEEEENARISDSVRVSLNNASGYILVIIDGKKEILLSEHQSCPICGFTIPELEPRLFSFNNPLGCCPECNGLGIKIEADPDLIIPDPTLSISQKAIPFISFDTIEYDDLLEIMKHYDIDLKTPINKLTTRQLNAILYGPEEDITYFRNSKNGSTIKRVVNEGVKNRIDRLYATTNSKFMKDWYHSFMSEKTCTRCHGARLNEQVLAVKINGYNINELCSLSFKNALKFFNEIELTDSEKTISDLVIKEIKNRLQFLTDVGLEYLTLSRGAATLSGGEAQRIRLATQIGSRLTGVLYVLDEPSIGLHQRDNDRLIKTLKEMRDLGNSMIVVEHDEDTIRSADFIVDVGPLAGDRGGEIICAGTYDEIIKNKNSITGQYLSGRKKIEIPELRRPGYKKITIEGATCHNLKNLTVSLPTGAFTCVTGVSGSGKSTLITEVLHKKARQELGLTVKAIGDCKAVKGLEHIDKVINISQEPIGKTPRSNPATYVKVFDDIRALFAQTREAKIKGFDSSFFSFNVKNGRCEECRGEGIKRISMSFLPDVYVECEVCHGRRYSDDVLEIEYKGKNIYDVLQMRVDEAFDFFQNIPSIRRKLETLQAVGLGYIKLGQDSTTLSGGEAQRVKLAFELQRSATGNTLYIMDEPTTGLHIDDVKKLLHVIDRLVLSGNTVVVIEHNLDMIKCADYIIDLGPEGGEYGGQLIACGTPEKVAMVEKSFTGKYLKPILMKEKRI